RNPWAGEVREARRADAVDRAVAVAEAAAGQADLPEHRGEAGERPARLLAVIGALDRPAHGKHRALRAHAVAKRVDHRRVDVADARCPGRVLRDAVGLAEEIRTPGFEADAILLQEREVGTLR